MSRIAVFSAPLASTVCALAVLLSGCASPPPPPPVVPSVKVILLPQEGQARTGVVVNGTGATQTLDTPYQRATTRQAQAPVVDNADPAQVQQQYDPLFKIAPPAPQRYVLYFQPGGTQLTPESQADLVRVLNDAAQRSGADVVVTGHTDTKGSQDSNDALSLRRAQQIRQQLVQQGGSADRIEAAGRGEREPAVPTRDEVDEPRNRRVEVIVR